MPVTAKRRVLPLVLAGATAVALALAVHAPAPQPCASRALSQQCRAPAGVRPTRTPAIRVSSAPASSARVQPSPTPTDGPIKVQVVTGWEGGYTATVSTLAITGGTGYAWTERRSHVRNWRSGYEVVRPGQVVSVEVEPLYASETGSFDCWIFQVLSGRRRVQKWTAHASPGQDSARCEWTVGTPPGSGNVPRHD